MGIFAPLFRKRIEKELRGDTPEERQKHFNELYVKYRDEMFVKSHGVTFLEWKESKAMEKDARFMSKHGMTYREWKKKKLNT